MALVCPPRRSGRHVSVSLGQIHFVVCTVQRECLLICSIHRDLRPACLCVSCAYIYSRVCSSVSCVPLKPDKLFSLSFWSISCKMPGCAHDANVLRQSKLFSQAHLLPKVSPTVLSRHINVWIKSIRSINELSY